MEAGPKEPLFTCGAAKGRPKEFDLFFSSSVTFGHFSDESVIFFVTFSPNSFRRSPFAAG